MSNKKLTGDQIEYRFRLIDYSRNILRDAIPQGFMPPEQYENRVIDLAEKIHNWVYDINEIK